MRSFVRNIIALCLGLGVFALASSASAEDNEAADVRQIGNDLTYEFFDDPLDAAGIAPTGGGITVVNRRIRTLLIRPRAQFVTEMLKSVENL